jgi:RNA polymerase sigma-70 factor, ECF subfamily
MGGAVACEKAVNSGDAVRHAQQLLGQILQQHYSGLARALPRRCGSEVDAMDLLHEAIRIAIEHHAVGRVACLERLPGYVFRVALNLLRNHRRVCCNRAERHVAEDAIDDIEWHEAGSAPDAVAAARLIEHAVASLGSERDRLVVKRFYLQDEDKHEICGDLGISSTHFDKVLHRARQRMKRFLESHGFTTCAALGFAVD